MYKTTFCKRLFIAFFYVALLCAFSSCSNSIRYRIGVSQCSDEPWRKQLSDEISRGADPRTDVSVEVLSASGNTQQQIRDIERFIEQKVDLIVVTPNEAEALVPVIEKAYDSGIKIVFTDRKANTEKFTSYIGVNFYEIGYNGARYLAQRFNGKAKMILLYGRRGASSSVEMHDGFVEYSKDFPELCYVAEGDADWSRQRAAAVFDSLIVDHMDVDVVICQNDEMAIGAAEAAAKYKFARRPLFMGIDVFGGPNPTIEKVSEGIIDVSTSYTPNGDEVFDLAMCILEGKPYQRLNLMQSAILDQTNIKAMRRQHEYIIALNERINSMSSNLGIFHRKMDVQQSYLYHGIIVLVVLLIMVLVLVRTSRIKSRLNESLSKQKSLLTEQKLKLNEQNRKLEEQTKALKENSDQLTEQTRQLEQKNILLEEQRDQMEEQRDKMAELTQKVEDATKAKLSFFTSVSHDLRTPLTLIVDPLMQLIEEGGFNDKQRQLLQIMHKNSAVMLRLVNQVLDFRKYESGNLPLVFSRFDVSQGLLEWSDAFKSLSYRHHVRFEVSIDPEVSDYTMIADPEKIERVVYNLLSNAFKYTPEKGTVRIAITVVGEDDARQLSMQVSDNGVGIDEEDAKHIFEYFYQADDSHFGSGIGLALVKAFVEMHHGTIDVSAKSDSGTTFSLLIPMVQDGPIGQEPSRREPVLDNMFLQGALMDADQESMSTADRVPEEADPVDEEAKDTVLVIDDNEDVRNYVKLSLQPDYHVIEAGNGQEGLRLAMRYVPEAIVCDVMMPVMDGLECCRRLKSELQTSQIPVILLTAYAMDDQRIQGYECGADSYITKPFSTALLKARVRSLIDQRRRTRQDTTTTITEVQQEPVSAVDQTFIERIRSYIYNNINNPELRVEEIGDEMGLSRVQLYRKVKTLTGYGPNELIRILRLKKASSLISSTERSVSEIAYDVGFTSPSYFAKCFKDYFGESPTDLAKRVR